VDSYPLVVYQDVSKVLISGQANVLSLLLLTTTTGCSALLLLKLRKAALPDLVDVSKKGSGDCHMEWSTSSRSASDMMDG